jgi:hypothetical protein
MNMASIISACVYSTKGEIIATKNLVLTDMILVQIRFSASHNLLCIIC